MFALIYAEDLLGPIHEQTGHTFVANFNIGNGKCFKDDTLRASSSGQSQSQSRSTLTHMPTEIWVITSPAYGLVSSTFVQAMAYCLMASSHYLDQCGFRIRIRQVSRHSSESNITLSVAAIGLYNEFKIYAFEFMITSPRGQ